MNTDMTTVVQTYLIEEVKDLIYDNENLEKWSNHVRKLGLDGQMNLASPDKSPIPFLCLNTQMKNALELLCPVHTKITEFSKTPIPNEILSLIDLSVNEDYFSEIQIWYDDKSPDPLCVGLIQQWCIDDKIETSYWQKSPTFHTKQLCLDAIKEKVFTKAVPYCKNTIEHYLIGRWADMAKTLDELKQQAKDRFMKKEMIEKKQEIKKLQRQFDDLESTTFEKFGI